MSSSCAISVLAAAHSKSAIDPELVQFIFSAEGWWVWVVGITIASLLSFAHFFGKREQQIKRTETRSLQIHQRDLFIRDLEARNGHPTPIGTDVVLKAGEEAWFSSCSALLEAKSNRVFGGVGLGRRVTGLGVGIGGGASTSFQTLSQIDDGSLVLTNQRIVFMGRMNARTIPIDKVAALDSNRYVDAVEIVIDGKQKCSVFTIANPLIFDLLFKIARQERSSSGPGSSQPSRRSRPKTQPQAVNFSCPHCRQHLEGDTSMVGQRIDCPNCQKAIEIPLR